MCSRLSLISSFIGSYLPDISLLAAQHLFSNHTHSVSRQPISPATMQLTVFANDGDQSYYLEVDASMHLEDLVALISAEVGLLQIVSTR